MITNASLKVSLFKDFFEFHHKKNNYRDFIYYPIASLITCDTAIQTICTSLIDYAQKQEQANHTVVYVNLSSSILLYQDLAILMDTINDKPLTNTVLLDYAYHEKTTLYHENEVIFETSLIPFYLKANTDFVESRRDCAIQKYKTNESAAPFFYNQSSLIIFKPINEIECKQHCFTLLKKLKNTFNAMVADYGNYGVIAAISVPEKDKGLILNDIHDFKAELKLNEYLFNPEKMQKHNITITYFSPILSEPEKESLIKYKTLLSRVTKIIDDRHRTKKCMFPFGKF